MRTSILFAVSRFASSLRFAISLALIASLSPSIDVCSAAPEVKAGAERADGWLPIFDGKSFAGWDPESSSPPDEWEARDGVLSTGPAIGGWLRTVKEYDDFELRLEFRLSPESNSGVFLRASGDTPHIDALEVQLLDDAEAPGPIERANGALLLESGPNPRASKKAGEWQTLFIRCQGPKVQVTLNGKLVVDEDLSKNQDREAAHPGRTKRKGRIGLQNRGELVSFRKLEIRELK